MLKTLVWLTSFYQFTLTEPIDYPAQLFPHSFKLPALRRQSRANKCLHYECPWNSACKVSPNDFVFCECLQGSRQLPSLRIQCSSEKFPGLELCHEHSCSGELKLLCKQSKAGFDCSCVEKKELACTPINECEQTPSACSGPTALCSDVPSGFECTCENYQATSPPSKQFDFYPVQVSPGKIECQPSCPNYPEVSEMKADLHRENVSLLIHQHVFGANILAASYPFCSEVKFDYFLCAHNLSVDILSSSSHGKRIQDHLLGNAFRVLEKSGVKVNLSTTCLDRDVSKLTGTQSFCILGELSSIILRDKQDNALWSSVRIDRFVFPNLCLNFCIKFQKKPGYPDPKQSLLHRMRDRVCFSSSSAPELDLTNPNEYQLQEQNGFIRLILQFKNSTLDENVRFFQRDDDSLVVHARSYNLIGHELAARASNISLNKSSHCLHDASGLCCLGKIQLVVGKRGGEEVKMLCPGHIYQIITGRSMKDHQTDVYLFYDWSENASDLCIKFPNAEFLTVKDETGSERLETFNKPAVPFAVGEKIELVLTEVRFGTSREIEISGVYETISKNDQRLVSISLESVADGSLFNVELIRSRKCDNDPDGTLSEKTFKSGNFFKSPLLIFNDFVIKTRTGENSSLEIKIESAPGIASEKLNISDYFLIAQPTKKCDQILAPNVFWAEAKASMFENNPFVFSLDAEICGAEKFSQTGSTKCCFELDGQKRHSLYNTQCCWVLLYVEKAEKHSFAEKQVRFIAAFNDSFIQEKDPSAYNLPLNIAVPNYIESSVCICYDFTCILQIQLSQTMDHSKNSSYILRTQNENLQSHGSFNRLKVVFERRNISTNGGDSNSLLFVFQTTETPHKENVQNASHFDIQVIAILDEGGLTNIGFTSCDRTIPDENPFNCFLTDDPTISHLTINCFLSKYWGNFSVLNLVFYSECYVAILSRAIAPTISPLEALENGNEDTGNKKTGTSNKKLWSRFASCQGERIYHGSVFYLNLILKTGSSWNGIQIANVTVKSKARKLERCSDTDETARRVTILKRTHFSVTLRIPCGIYQSNKDNITSMRMLLIELPSPGDRVGDTWTECDDIHTTRWMQSGNHEEQERWLTSQFFFQHLCPEATNKDAGCDKEAFYQYQIGSDSDEFCAEEEAQNRSCNGALRPNQVYSAWLFSYSSPVLCVGTDLGFISTRKLITADEINLRPLLFIFLVLKVTLFIIFYSIFHVAKTAHRRKRYFMKKQRQLSVFKSTDPVFNYRYPIWNKHFGSFLKSQEFHTVSEEQFDSLNRTFPFFSRKTALLKDNFYRNRFTKRHLPFEEHMVTLPHVEVWEKHTKGYINASFIAGPMNRNPTEYILAQDPMKVTVNNFLHMIYAYDVRVVVAVVGRPEDRFYDYAPRRTESMDPRQPVKYYPVAVEDNRYQSIGDFEVRNKSWNEVGTGCRELDLKRKDNIAAKKKIIQFTFDLQVAESEKWSWKNIDEVLSQLEMLHRLVNEFASKLETRTKFVAHCSSGDRLSGFVVAAYRLQREIETAKYVDVMGCVADLRRCRNIRVIPNIRQYKLLHLITCRYFKKRGYTFTNRWTFNELLPADIFEKTDISSLSDDSFSSVSFNIDSTDVAESINEADEDYAVVKLDQSQSDYDLPTDPIMERIAKLSLAYPNSTYRSSGTRNTLSRKSSLRTKTTNRTTSDKAELSEDAGSSRTVKTLDSSVQTSPSLKDSSVSLSDTEDDLPQRREVESLPKFSRKASKSTLKSKPTVLSTKTNPPKILTRNDDSDPPPILPRNSGNSTDNFKFYVNRQARYYPEKPAQESPSLVSRFDGLNPLNRWSNRIVRKGTYDVGQSPEGTRRIPVPTKTDDLVSSATEFLRATSRDIERRRQPVPAHLRDQKKRGFVKTAHTFTYKNFLKDLNL